MATQCKCASQALGARCEIRCLVRRYRRRWWRFGLSDPGASLAGCAIIGHHRDRNIARSGLGSPEGEAQVRHFEVHGPAPAFDAATKAPFLIRETRVRSQCRRLMPRLVWAL